MTLRTLLVIAISISFATVAVANPTASPNDATDSGTLVAQGDEVEFEDFEDLESEEEPAFEDFEDMDSGAESDGGVEFEEWGDDSEAAEFEEADGDFEAIGLPRITGIFRASEILAGPLAERLSEVLNEKLDELAEYEQVEPGPLNEEFEVMGQDLADECAFDPVCMGRLGRDLGIDYIVVGRVEEGDETGTWATTLNVVDAVNGTIDNFVYFTTDARTVSVQEQIDAQVNRLLRIRTFEDDEGLERGSGRGQRIVGWTALGLGVAAIGTGAYFGLDFASQKNDLEDCTVVDGLNEPLTGADVCAITQVEANQMIDDMRPSRNRALILTGAGAGLVVTGTVLLLINAGQDAYDVRDTASRGPRFQVSPTFTRGGFGVSSNLEF